MLLFKRVQWSKPNPVWERHLGLRTVDSSSTSFFIQLSQSCLLPVSNPSCPWIRKVTCTCSALHSFIKIKELPCDSGFPCPLTKPVKTSLILSPYKWAAFPMPTYTCACILACLLSTCWQVFLSPDNSLIKIKTGNTGNIGNGYIADGTFLSRWLFYKWQECFVRNVATLNWIKRK